MSRRFKSKFFLSFAFLSLCIFVGALFFFFKETSLGEEPSFSTQTFFQYDFDLSTKILEAGSEAESSHPEWWLNSGAEFIQENGTGKTLQGELQRNTMWRMLYAKTNPVDTDNGYHPQNIFRFLTRKKWENFQEEVYFKINKVNLSESKNRDTSSGILLFSRYKDGSNFYYVGIRQDGALAIKKKLEGKYYILALKSFYVGTKSYDRKDSPNLIPMEQWIGIRSAIQNNPDGTVWIKLYVDKEKKNEWKLELEAIDDGKNFGGAPIFEEGYAGIRSDFMDIEFDDFYIQKF